MPTMTKETLIKWSSTAIKPTADLRAQYYYDTVRNDYAGDWMQFHDAWAGIYESTLYDSLIDLGEEYDTIAYQIHPAEFLKFESAILNTKHKKLIYIDLDLDKHGQWVLDESRRLKFQPRGNEYIDGIVLKNKYAMPVISLSNILDSTEGFLIEYDKLCNLAGVPTAQASALSLYENWKKHRVIDA